MIRRGVRFSTKPIIRCDRGWGRRRGEGGCERRGLWDKLRLLGQSPGVQRLRASAVAQPRVQRRHLRLDDTFILSFSALSPGQTLMPNRLHLLSSTRWLSTPRRWPLQNSEFSTGLIFFCSRREWKGRIFCGEKNWSLNFDQDSGTFRVCFWRAESFDKGVCKGGSSSFCKMCTIRGKNIELRSEIESLKYLVWSIKCPFLVFFTICIFITVITM